MTKRKPRTWTEWRLVWPGGEVDTIVCHSRREAMQHIGWTERTVFKVRVTEIVSKPVTFAVVCPKCGKPAEYRGRPCPKCRTKLKSRTR